MVPSLRYPSMMMLCRPHTVLLHACRADATALQQVGSGAASFNNQREVAGNRALTILKMMYYYCFATLYGAAGGCAHVRLLVTDQASSVYSARYCGATAAVVHTRIVPADSVASSPDGLT